MERRWAPSHLEGAGADAGDVLARHGRARRRDRGGGGAGGHGRAGAWWARATWWPRPRQAFANIATVLRAAGCGMRDVVRFQTFLTYASDIDAFMQARREVFPDVLPGRRLSAQYPARRVAARPARAAGRDRGHGGEGRQAAGARRASRPGGAPARGVRVSPAPGPGSGGRDGQWSPLEIPERFNAATFFVDRHVDGRTGRARRLPPRGGTLTYARPPGAGEPDGQCLLRARRASASSACSACCSTRRSSWPRSGAPSRSARSRSRSTP